MEQQPSRFAKWSLVIGIVIVLNMFFNYAITLIYPAPVFKSVYSGQQIVRPIETREACLNVGGQWTEAPIAPIPQFEKSQPRSAGYCDSDYSARIRYDALRASYERNVFILLVVLGILSIIAGVWAAQDVLSAAFSWGGVVSLVIASTRYWANAGNILKVIILACALGGLVWIAVRKFGAQGH